MQNTKYILSKTISVVLHPLFVPTYSIASILIYLKAAWQYTMVATALCFILTCLCPLLEIWLRVRAGKLTSIELYEQKERTIPYLISMLCMALWCLFAYNLELPMTIVGIYITCTVLLLVVMLINLKWKISIHLTSFGAYAGMMAIITFRAGYMWLFPLLLLVALLLMYARIYLKAHTPRQVVVGFLLGLVVASVSTYLLMPQ